MCYLIFFEWKHFLIEDFQISEYFPNVPLQKMMTFFSMDYIQIFPVNGKYEIISEMFICLAS